MPVPKQRLASRRGRTRASHHGLVHMDTIECPECHQPALPHRACPACGAYRGRNVRTKIVKTEAPVQAAPAAVTSAVTNG